MQQLNYGKKFQIEWEETTFFDKDPELFAELLGLLEAYVWWEECSSIFRVLVKEYVKAIGILLIQGENIRGDISNLLASVGETPASAAEQMTKLMQVADIHSDYIYFSIL